ncbi:gamma-glutamyltransferase [Pyruvatibacter sp.]|uniref:gamma-glutamyltransferase n=1 Tax=Pyruvatibacter sp. TaxID=1981328 RepID=UPI00326704AA
MRDFQRPGRSTVHSLNGMCASSHPQASLTAVDIMKRGGNAVDAAVAASAVLCVVEPMMTGIGGDCFVLFAPKGSSDVIGLNGSGRAPAGATRDYFVEQGLDTIGETSVHSISIPGAIDAWARLLADHGTMGMDEVLAPAIAFAEEGFALSPRIAIDWMFLVPQLKNDPDIRSLYLPSGDAPGIGSIWKSPALGRTLRAIGERGRAGFYEGEIAERMVQTLQAKGGLHTLEDFANTSADYVTPISTDTRGHRLLEIPPNGQGITALIALNILDRLNVDGLDPRGPERVHLQVEAARRAYAARDMYVADMDQAQVPVDHLLSDAFADAIAAEIDPSRAAELPTAQDNPHKDTTYLTVVDKDRNAVSFINSLFQGFGSTIADEQTGVVFQNRAAGFVLEDGHPNCIAPNKRPMHTIIPAMLVKDEKAVMPFGVMGGHYQPMGHVQVVLNMLAYGMDIQEAIDFPRFLTEDGTLAIERGLPAATLEGLTARGHRVAEAVPPFGGGQGIAINWEQGTLTGGSDPRKDGAAIGY